MERRMAGSILVARERRSDIQAHCEVSVVVPTYNEAENVRELIPLASEALRGYEHEIVVVDDSSPDGTAEVARELSKSYPVKLLLRRKKLGLASAIVYGFENATGEILGVIDADLQHPPEYIMSFIEKIREGYDIVIGSRYVKGGRIEGWGLKRKILSRGAIMLAKPLAGGVKDPMSGYFFIRRHVIEGIDFKLMGYKLLLEILVKGKYRGVAEVPYVFRERQNGESKLGRNEIANYIKLLAHLYKYRIWR